MTSPFLKALRVLFVAILYGVGIFSAPVVLPYTLSAQAAARHTSTHAPSVAEQYLLAMANQERGRVGAQPLVWDDHLAAAALAHAERMAQERAISHQFAGEAELQARAANAGARFRLIAENVAVAPTPQILHSSWMHSEGHRYNLLEPQENAVGIAVVQRDGQLYAVEDFSESVADTGLAGQEMQVIDLLHVAGMAEVAATEDARKSCTMSTGYAGKRLPYFVMRYTTSDLSMLPAQLKVKLADKRMHSAAVGACTTAKSNFSNFSIAVLLYP
ncbi:MAG TPA: CAP domain-containing protein [Acidobacteriaceae bacterium]